MPGRIDEYYIALVPNALALPPAVLKAFRANPIDANIMSAHAFDVRAKESAGEPAPPHQFWIICGPDEDNIDLVLSCTEDPIHQYPIFLFAPNPSAQSNMDFLEPRIGCLVDLLYATVPHQRVFSVVAPDLMSHIFAGMWSHVTGIPNYPKPYYHAKLTYCDLESLKPVDPPELPYELRLANEAEIPEAANLCYEFSLGSASTCFMCNWLPILTCVTGALCPFKGWRIKGVYFSCKEQAAMDPPNAHNGRTFGDSNYRRCYSQSPPRFRHNQSIH
jgi:hypothetical protein